MTLDYFYGQAGELFSFYRIPKALFQEPRFQSLSTDAKTLYGILLDRMSLSVKNGWLDEQNRMSRGRCVAQTTKRPSCSGNSKSLVWLNENAEVWESQVWCMWRTFQQNRQNQYSRIVIFTILEASKAQVKTLQNHDVIRLMKIILKRVKRILSIQKKQMRWANANNWKSTFLSLWR